MAKLKTSKTLNIKIKDKEINTFKSAINKINTEVERVGFKNFFINDEEAEMFRNIEEQLNETI